MPGGKIIFKFKITSISAGWLDAEIANEDNKTAYLTASYLNDMPKMLLERLNKLALHQTGEYAVPIFQEPGIEILHICREKDIVKYTFYRLIDPYVALSDQQDQVNNNFQMKFYNQDSISQSPHIVVLQSSDCYKISLGNDVDAKTTTLTINRFAFEDTENFESRFRGKTSFFEFFNNIVQDIGKYSCGENLECYNKEWSNGAEWGFKFPTEEYDKSLMIIDELQKNNAKELI